MEAPGVAGGKGRGCRVAERGGTYPEILGPVDASEALAA